MHLYLNFAPLFFHCSNKTNLIAIALSMFLFPELLSFIAQKTVPRHDNHLTITPIPSNTGLCWLLVITLKVVSSWSSCSWYCSSCSSIASAMLSLVLFETISSYSSHSLCAFWMTLHGWWLVWLSNSLLLLSFHIYHRIFAVRPMWFLPSNLFLASMIVLHRLLNLLC